MKKLLISALAASAALLPATALAQPAAGHSWGRGGTGTVVRHSGPRTVVRHHGGDAVRHHRRDVVRHEGRNLVRRDFRHVRGSRHHGRRFGHVRRIERGFMVPHFWFGPQFHVRNWQVYGFAQPVHDRRWIRYYDDALLIDGRGMVHDGRYGLDWDQYGDNGWSYDDRGIPVYVGEGEFHPDQRDYEWAEEHESRGYGHAQPGFGGCYPAQPCAPAMGYGAAYGYGWGAGTVTITETTTTTVPQTGYVEEIIEEEVVSRPRRRARRARPCNCAPVRPQPGERG